LDRVRGSFPHQSSLLIEDSLAIKYAFEAAGITFVTVWPIIGPQFLAPGRQNFIKGLHCWHRVSRWIYGIRCWLKATCDAQIRQKGKGHDNYSCQNYFSSHFHLHTSLGLKFFVVVIASPKGVAI
jgi:hypothetical protein